MELGCTGLFAFPVHNGMKYFLKYLDFFHLLKGGKSFASDCLLCASTWLIFELFLTIF